MSTKRYNDYSSHASDNYMSEGRRSVGARSTGSRKSANLHSEHNEDLEAKYHQAKETQLKYMKELEEINKKTIEVRETTTLTMQKLQNEQDALQKENDTMTKDLEDLPEMDFLTRQYELLKALSQKKRLNKQGTFLDLAPVRKTGIIGPNESLAALPQRINQLHRLIEAEAQAQIKEYKEVSMSYIESNPLPDDEEDLQRRVDLIEPVHKTVKELTTYQKESVRREIKILELQLEDLKKAEKRRIEEGVPFDDVAAAVEANGGNKSELREIGDNKFMIGHSKFDVQKSKNGIVVTSPTKSPLPSFVQDTYRSPFDSYVPSMNSGSNF